MKILYISSSKLPSRQANGVHVMKMCQALARQGHQVIMLARRGEKKIKEDIWGYYGVKRCFEIEKLSLFFGFLEKIFYILRVWYYILRNKNKYQFFYGRFLYGMWLVSKIKTSFSYESHSPPHGIIEKIAEKSTLKSPYMRSVVVISNALKDIYKKTYSWLDPKKILVAHDGADVLREKKKFQKNTEGETLKGKKEINVGYVGSLYKGRGVELIIQIAEKIPKAAFHIIGGSKTEIDPYRHLTKSTNVHFYGKITHSKIRTYLEQFDILLAPYQRKVGIAKKEINTVKWMSPLKVFEYMSHGKAIVVSDLPVLREVLEHQKTALLCNPENIDEWVEAIVKLQNEKLREVLGKNAKRELEKKYGWDKRVRDILGTASIYENNFVKVK